MTDQEYEDCAAHARELNLDVDYTIIQGCPECGGPVRLWVGDVVGKCLHCGREVNMIEPF